MENIKGVVRLQMPYDQRPEPKDLTKFLTDYCQHWKEIGLLLGLKLSVLDLVASAHPMQDRECFRATLEKWLQLNVGVTWANLELAITNANRQSLGLQPLTTVLTSQPEAAVIHPDGHQPQQVNNKQEDTKNEINRSESVGSEKVNTTLIINPNKAISEFATTVSKIEKILITSGNEDDNLDAIKSICAFLPISNNSDKPMFTAEQLKEIDACSNIREMFRQLRFHLRWDDHLILTAILDRLDCEKYSEECEELLAKFESKIDCQMKLEQIFEECKKQKQEVPKGFDKMVAIVNKKYSRITKEEYDQLKWFITEHCGVESYVLSPFLNMSPSSLLLEWLVPSTAIIHMVETATKHKHLFIKESFVFLQISTTVILDCSQNDSESSQSNSDDEEECITLNEDEFQTLIVAFNNGDVVHIQNLLNKISYISSDSRIYCDSGSSVNLLWICTITQQVEIFKLLTKNYSINPYSVFMDTTDTVPYFHFIFSVASESFIIAILDYCGVKATFTYNNISVLHFAVYTNCFDVVQYLVEECSDTDVNIIDDNLQTPLHLAYLCGHTQITQYLIKNGADVYAVDIDGCVPYEYVDGNPDIARLSKLMQNKRKIYQLSGSAARHYYMRLVNLGIDEEEAVFLTLEQFSSIN